MLHLAEGIDVIAAVVIGIASLRAAATAARLFLQRAASNSDKEEVRLKLGLWLSLALELVLGADILRTTIAPSWEEIGKLAGRRGDSGRSRDGARSDTTRRHRHRRAR